MRNKFSLLTVLALVIAPVVALVAPLNVSAAITAMSITGTGITADSSDTATAITPTINFTTAAALVSDGDQLYFSLNGMTVVDAVDGLAVTDLTLSCSNGAQTLELAPGTADNGAHEVSITNGANGDSDPSFTITLDSAAGPVAPNCAAGAATLDVAAGQVDSSTTAGNYPIHIVTSQESGSFLYYVGDENDVQVQADVDPVLTFVIRNAADDADQPNVAGAAVGPNLCDLGNLSDAGVQECQYRLKVTTNASGGYTVAVATDGSLRKGTDFIDNIAEDTLVTAGAEDYGVAFAAGSYDPDGVGTDYTATACTPTADFDDDDTPTATGLATGITQNLYSCAGPNNPDATDLGNTALVTHRAEADSATPAGTYVQLVTYTVTASF